VSNFLVLLSTLILCRAVNKCERSQLTLFILRIKFNTCHIFVQATLWTILLCTGWRSPLCDVPQLESIISHYMFKHADMNLRALNLNVITLSHYEGNMHCYINVQLKVTANRGASNIKWFPEAVVRYEGCPESIRPFRISREPVAWPWCNLAAIQRKPCCASVNNHSPLRLVSRQWDAVDWVSLLYERRILNDRASRSAPSQCACPFYSSLAGFFFWQSISSPRSVSPLLPRFGSPWLLAFPKPKVAVEWEEFCERDGHTTHKVSQRCLTANWLASRVSYRSLMRSKVSTDLLQSYIKATWPVFEIFKMSGYFPDRPRI
jgi:hypothetical protein